jgi:hypothetical protein
MKEAFFTVIKDGAQLGESFYCFLRHSNSVKAKHRINS